MWLRKLPTAKASLSCRLVLLMEKAHRVTSQIWAQSSRLPPKGCGGSVFANEGQALCSFCLARGPGHFLVPRFAQPQFLAAHPSLMPKPVEPQTLSQGPARSIRCKARSHRRRAQKPRPGGGIAAHAPFYAPETSNCKNFRRPHEHERMRLATCKRLPCWDMTRVSGAETRF